MHSLVRDVQKSQLKKVPEIKPGYTIRVHQKIKEGDKERVQVFEGLVIKVGHGEGIEKTITVRKIVQGIGVEKVFPIHSSNIKKIEVKKKAKVRRAKLYYMRQRFGKSARLQERQVTEKERAEEGARMETMIQEAVKAEEKKRAEEAAAEAKEEGEATEVPESTAATQGGAVETPQGTSPEEGAIEKPAEETLQAPGDLPDVATAKAGTMEPAEKKPEEKTEEPTPEAEAPKGESESAEEEVEKEEPKDKPAE